MPGVMDWTPMAGGCGVLAKGLYREPSRTLERVVQAMHDVGLDASVTSDEWRVYFPDRSRVLP